MTDRWRAGAIVVACVLTLVAGGCSDPKASDPALVSAEPTATRVPVTTPASSPGPGRTPRFIETPLPTDESTVQFDGTFYGWRFAPLDALRAAGLDGGDPRECDAQQYGPTHPTDLDFGVPYLPSGPRTEEVTKSACGDSAWIVNRQIFYEETGVLLTMTRARRAYASLPIEVAASYVQSCEIAGRPAVCVHYQDDATGRYGHPAAIIVVEHQALDPYGIYFMLTGEEIPFAELVKIASSVSLD